MSEFSNFIIYLRSIRRYSLHTIVAYRSDLKQAKRILKKSLHSLTRSDIQKFITYLKENNYSIKSIKRKYEVLKSYLKYHFKRKKIKELPYRGIPAVRGANPVMYFIPLDITLSILDSIKAGENRKRLRDKLALELLYYTGCRADEIIRLKKKNVDYDNLRIKVLGKGKKERYVPISKTLANLIHIHLKKWRGKNKGPYVLSDNQGKRMYPMFLWRLIRKYFTVELTGKKVSAHIIRHSISTHLYILGAPIKIIMELLGHRYLRSTAIYLHPDLEYLKKLYIKCHPKS